MLFWMHFLVWYGIRKGQQNRSNMAEHNGHLKLVWRRIIAARLIWERDEFNNFMTNLRQAWSRRKIWRNGHKSSKDDKLASLQSSAALIERRNSIKKRNAIVLESLKIFLFFCQKTANLQLQFILKLLIRRDDVLNVSRSVLKSTLDHQGYSQRVSVEISWHRWVLWCKNQKSSAFFLLVAKSFNTNYIFSF